MERIMNNYWWTYNGNSRKSIKWLAWDKICLEKCDGGLGFRSLHGFNLALLGKHVWKFVSNPTSLVARVYKAKYFQDCSILQATKENGSSFIWAGIWEAKEMVCKGYRWVLGDGRDINTFKDPWLRGKRNFRVEDHHSNNNRGDKVFVYFRQTSNNRMCKKYNKLFMMMILSVFFEFEYHKWD